MKQLPPIHTQADLHEAWRTLMQPLGFSGHSIWLMFLTPDGEALPQLTEITEAADPPSAGGESGLAEVLRHFADLRAAFLRTRPGPAVITADDRAWARSLYAACRSAEVPAEVVHLATDTAIVALPRDELAA
ncbi:hypothetical protein [Nocardioides sp. LS1]|uniref:hypothetical protein n=1 Tax=Nocardioides sp. LS1 TaxID=1027620 RepID=UPI000F61BE6F|nr:hypothetical protein [Nocardioides sp. LS1]GCD91422.1 hypothetical protein NLS1_34280 [Nocardioides sp. LS1]